MTNQVTINGIPQYDAVIQISGVNISSGGSTVTTGTSTPSTYTPPPVNGGTFGWPQGQPVSQFTKPVVLGQTLTFLVPIPPTFTGSGKFTVSNTIDTPQDMTFDVWWTQGSSAPIAMQHGHYPSATLNFTCAPNPPNWQTPVAAAPLYANVKVTQGSGGTVDYRLN
jgi:hypothetical protein